MLPIYVMLMDNEEDRNKFEYLYKTHRKLLFAVAQKIVQDAYLAEDVVHHTFLTALQRMELLRELSEPKARSLLVTIARHHAINLYRRQKSHPILPLDENLHAAHDVVPPEGADELVCAILSLPELYRGVATLKYIQEYKNKEIAEILQITESTVRKRLERAKKKVAQMLKKGDVSHETNFH